MAECADSESRLILHRGFDVLAVAAEAVIAGTATDEHWAILLAQCERDGVVAASEQLGVRLGPGGPCAAWWRCVLELRTQTSPETIARACAELAELDANGGGPRYDLDHHALEISDAVRYLQTYLERLRRDTATNIERSATSMVVHCVRVARNITRHVS